MPLKSRSLLKTRDADNAAGAGAGAGAHIVPRLGKMGKKSISWQ